MTAGTLHVGWTTGLWHEHTAAIDECAAYLPATPPINRPAPLVPHMRAMFGIGSADVCEAIREAQRVRSGAA